MKNNRYTSAAAVGLALVAIAVLVPASAGAQTVKVLRRARIGGYSEGITYVSHGPLANHLVFLDGYEAWRIPNDGRGRGKARPLFDLRGLGINEAPRGIAYVESERRFFLNDPSWPDRLFVVDHRGRNMGTRTVTPVRDGSRGYYEGMAYVPGTADRYPDHLARVWSSTSSDSSVVDVTTRSGQVVATIVPDCSDDPDPTYSGAPLSVTYLPGDRLLLADAGQYLCTVDFDGVRQGPLVPVDTISFVGEGVARIDDGRIAVLAAPQDLLYFDAELNRLAEDDRHIVVGLGLTFPWGLAWRPERAQFLVSYTAEDAIGASPVAAVSSRLTSAFLFADLSAGLDPAAGVLSPRGMDYLGEERRLVVACRGQGALPDGTLPSFRGLLLYDDGGSLVERLDLTGVQAHLPPEQRGKARAVAFDTAANQFLVGFYVEQTRLYVVARDGTPTGTYLDLGATAGVTSIVAAAYANERRGERLLVLDWPGVTGHLRLVITDLSGTMLGEVDVRSALGVVGSMDIAALTAGAHTVAYAITDREGGELVVFVIE